MKHGAVPTGPELAKGTMVVYHEYYPDKVFRLLQLLSLSFSACVKDRARERRNVNCLPSPPSAYHAGAPPGQC
jgi:hypothetical protein